jgi:hypothetical protein
MVCRYNGYQESFTAFSQAARLRALQGEHRLLPDPVGCFYRSWRGDLWIPWYNVTAIEQDEHSLYLILSGAGPLYQYGIGKRLTKFCLDWVCIIPKRFFANPLEAEIFLDQARTLRENALLPQPEIGFSKRAA